MYEALLIGSALLYLAVGAAYARSRQAHFAHPATFYLAFHGLVFVLRPMLAAWLEFDFIYRLYDFTPSMADKITVIPGANLGMLVFVGGACWLCRGGEALPDRDDAAWRDRLRQPVLIAGAMIAPLGIWSQLSNWGQRAGLYDSMVRDAATGTLINTSQIGWFTDLGLALAPLAVLLVWVARYRWWSWPFFGVFAVLQAGTGTRGPLIYAALALAILYLIETRRSWPEWRSLVSIALLALIFGQILADRGQSVRRSFQSGPASYASTETRGLKPLEDMDFANLEYFEFVVYAVPQRTGSYDLFASNLQILTEPIPRALWRDKPVGSPVQFFSLWDYGRPVGMTLSVPGAGWMALGWAGIVIQSLVFALLYGGLYRALVMRRNGAVALLAYALLGATAVVVLRDGVLISLVRVLPFYLGPLVLVLGVQRLLRAAEPSTVYLAGGPTNLSPAQRRQELAARGASS